MTALNFQQSVGVITGYPNHSLYGIGVKDQKALLCFDPHRIQYMDYISTNRKEQLNSAVQVTDNLYFQIRNTQIPFIHRQSMRLIIIPLIHLVP